MYFGGKKENAAKKKASQHDRHDPQKNILYAHMLKRSKKSQPEVYD